ncbi:MAG: hypothetical protein AAF989_03090, partial [Planctomycetota bacterium]
TLVLAIDWDDYEDALIVTSGSGSPPQISFAVMELTNSSGVVRIGDAIQPSSGSLSALPTLAIIFDTDGTISDRIIGFDRFEFDETTMAAEFADDQGPVPNLPVSYPTTQGDGATLVRHQVKRFGEVATHELAPPIPTSSIVIQEDRREEVIDAASQDDGNRYRLPFLQVVHPANPSDSLAAEILEASITTP